MQFPFREPDNYNEIIENRNDSKSGGCHLWENH